MAVGRTVSAIGSNNELEASSLLGHYFALSCLLQPDGDALIVLLYTVERERSAKLNRSAQLLNGFPKDELVTPLSDD